MRREWSACVLGWLPFIKQEMHITKINGYGKKRKNLSNIQRDKQSAATIVA
jgi:hypothetical protein